jgi:hypothetical protein
MIIVLIIPSPQEVQVGACGRPHQQPLRLRPQQCAPSPQVACGTCHTSTTPTSSSSKGARKYIAYFEPVEHSSLVHRRRVARLQEAAMWLGAAEFELVPVMHSGSKEVPAVHQLER